MIRSIQCILFLAGGSYNRIEFKNVRHKITKFRCHIENRETSSKAIVQEQVPGFHCTLFKLANTVEDRGPLPPEHTIPGKSSVLFYSCSLFNYFYGSLIFARNSATVLHLQHYSKAPFYESLTFLGDLTHTRFA